MKSMVITLLFICSSSLYSMEPTTTNKNTESTPFDINTHHEKIGLNPLHIAAAHNTNQKVIELLLQYGADPNKRVEGNGYTPLHYACQYNRNKAIIEALLISLGAKKRES